MIGIAITINTKRRNRGGSEPAPKIEFPSAVCEYNVQSLSVEDALMLLLPTAVSGYFVDSVDYAITRPSIVLPVATVEYSVDDVALTLSPDIEFPVAVMQYRIFDIALLPPINMVLPEAVIGYRTPAFNYDPPLLRSFEPATVQYVDGVFNARLNEPFGRAEVGRAHVYAVVATPIRASFPAAVIEYEVSEFIGRVTADFTEADLGRARVYVVRKV